MTPDPLGSCDLEDYEVLVAVSGGIAAYKVCEVVSNLVQRGAGVTVAMTPAARKFVGRTTFEALSGRRVLTSLWASDEVADSVHIRVTAATDLLLIAPATANTIGKLACGIADDLVSTLAISTDSLVAVAPAMNERMWNHPAVQRNVALLRERGCTLVGPGRGWLACRTVGEGRMSDAAEIVTAVAAMLVAKPAKAARR